MTRGTTKAIFAECGKIFSSILLLIAVVRSGVKKSASILISFGEILSIPVALLYIKTFNEFFHFHKA